MATYCIRWLRSRFLHSPRILSLLAPSTSVCGFTFYPLLGAGGPDALGGVEVQYPWLENCRCRAAIGFGSPCRGIVSAMPASLSFFPMRPARSGPGRQPAHQTMDPLCKVRRLRARSPGAVGLRQASPAKLGDGPSPPKGVRQHPRPTIAPAILGPPLLPMNWRMPVGLRAELCSRLGALKSRDGAMHGGQRVGQA